MGESSRFLIKAALIVGSGGLIFGYDIGVISGTLGKLTDVFNLNGYEQGLVVSILNAGSIVGCIFGGPLCDVLGRWRTIHLQNAIFILGALITGLATNLSTLCAGRFLVGVASAISGLADVPYLTEISPAQYRGMLSGQYEILVALGVLVSFCLDLAFSTFSAGWRVAFVVPAGLALVQSLCMLLLPESPQWLMAKGDLAAARSALMDIYGEKCVDHWIERGSAAEEKHHGSLDDLKSSFPSEDECPTDILTYLRLAKSPSDATCNTAALDNLCSGDSDRSSNSRGLVSDVELAPYVADANPNKHMSKGAMSSTFGLSDEETTMFRSFSYPIIMIIIIQLLSQSSTVIRNYAAIIIEESGASTQRSLVLNVVLGIIKLFFTILSVFQVEKHGRRNLMLLGILVVCSGLTFLTLASAASRGGNLHSPVLFLLGCTAISAGFGCGYGPVPWILSSEMVPPLIRARIMSVSLIASNVSQLVMGLVFVPMYQNFTSAGAFAVFLMLSVINFVYIYLFLTETKDVLPEIILDDLHHRYVQICNGQRNVNGKEIKGSPTTDETEGIKCTEFTNPNNSNNHNAKSTKPRPGHDSFATNPMLQSKEFSQF